MIKTLVHVAICICSKTKLNLIMLSLLRKIYFKLVTLWILCNLAFVLKFAQFNKPNLYSLENCPVYLQLLLIGEVSTKDILGKSLFFCQSRACFHFPICWNSFGVIFCTRFMLVQWFIITYDSEVLNILAKLIRGW